MLADWGSVQDLAAHFADGRLSTEKLLAADDEELYTMLTSIHGIGRVSATSFDITSASLTRVPIPVDRSVIGYLETGQRQE